MGFLAAMHIPTPEEHITSHRLLRNEADRESFQLRGGVKKRLPDSPQGAAVLVHFYSNLDKLDLQEEPDIFARVLREPCGGMDLAKVRQLWNLDNLEVLHPTPQSFMAMNLGANRHFLPCETVQSLIAHDGWISVTEGPVSADVLHQRRLRNAYLALNTMWINLNALSSDIGGDTLRWFGFFWLVNTVSIALHALEEAWKQSTARKLTLRTTNYCRKLVVPKVHRAAMLVAHGFVRALGLALAAIRFLFERMVFRSLSISANWITRATSPETEEDEHHGELLKGVLRLLSYAGCAWLVLFSSCLVFRLACHYFYD